MLRLLSLIVLGTLAFPQLLSAQRDETAILSAAIAHMKKDLGPQMVVDARNRVSFIRRGSAPDSLTAIAQRLAVREIEPTIKCSAKGQTYVTGPEKYVLFNEPQIVGDTARMYVHWFYTTEGTSNLNTWVTGLLLHRGTQGWTVLQAYGRESLSSSMQFCDPVTK